MQWGPKGRDDLGMMRAMGANTVRLYHSIGLEQSQDHSGFLDHANSMNMHVLPGVHTDAGLCKDFDCYDTWKASITKSFTQGFAKDNLWHEAIPIVILLNEPDFFEMQPDCPNKASWCRCKAALSALDGFVAAEKDAGVKGGTNMTITWSFGQRTSVDGKVTGPGVYGFQDMKAILADPTLAHYTPRTPIAELREVFRTRWVNGVNNAAPYKYIKSVVNNVYKQFEPHPWFIGEHGLDKIVQSAITADMKASSDDAQSDPYYLGLSMFQYQQSYSKGDGAEMDFGLFSLGDTKIGQTGDVYEGGAASKWPVYCLNTKLTRPASGGIYDGNDHRAEAVAAGWGGTTNAKGRCKPAQGEASLLV